jgi:serine/threonine protein kinase
MMKPQLGREPLRRWDPERLGPYVILGRLGAGSMGEVYLGRSASGRLVAVKTIRPGLAEEAGFRTRFAQEVAAARKVSGVFTAAVVEADPDADLPWLATAYVPAPSLARLVAACGPMPVAAVRWLAAGCAEALASIHAVGLVHRDLKPSNVLVAPDGPKVIDFGVARAAERIALTTARGAIGTPAYMAPEQARDTRQASVASDVYSLGATLVFAATGHAPYAGDTVMDVLARLATEAPDLSGLPDELGDLVGSCMQRVPSARPTSSQVLARLGPFAEAGTAAEHSYLPEAARAMIGEYQRTPLPAGGPSDDDRSDDATNYSDPGLPASFLPSHRSPGPIRRTLLAHAWAGPRWLPSSWRRWIRKHLGWVGWASVGAALIAVGVILGASVTSSGDGFGPGNGPGNGPPPPPMTVCGKGVSVTDVTSPTLCMVRTSQGSQATAFAVEGLGFAPDTPVTVNLTELAPPPAQPQILDITSPVKPVTGPGGTFTFTVKQVYAAQLQLGILTVTVTGTGGRQASTQFMVIPSG